MAELIAHVGDCRDCECCCEDSVRTSFMQTIKTEWTLDGRCKLLHMQGYAWESQATTTGDWLILHVEVTYSRDFSILSGGRR